VKNRALANKARQSGAVLIISLLLLVVLTVLGVVMMQTTRMQERMAGNTRDLNAALQTAEAGLRYGENVLAGYGSLPDATSALPCTVCTKGTLPVAIADPTQFDWGVDAQTYGNVMPANSPAPPQYTTEELGFVPDSLVGGQDPPEGRDFYQVTSHSGGLTGQANTVLQSTYARRF
jgi:type IV pilus assembly protein PilX